MCHVSRADQAQRRKAREALDRQARVRYRREDRASSSRQQKGDAR